jgi:putative heme transporter
VAVVDPQIRLPGKRIVVLLALLAVVFWFARPVLLPFAVAAIIAYAFSPYVDRLQARTGRSRLLIVVVLYGLGLLIVAALVAAFAGPISREAELLARAGPDALTTAIRQVPGGGSVTIGEETITADELAVQAQAALRAFLQTPEGAIRAAQGLLQGAFDLLLLLIVVFYLLLDGGRLAEPALRFLSPTDRAEVRRVAGRIHVVVGRWLRGQLVLVAFVAAVCTVVFAFVLRLPSPLALGALVGVLNVVTFIGPIVAGVVVAIVALATGGPPLAIASVVFLTLLRQAENVLIMPAVLGRAVNLHPLVALFAVVVGSTAFGVVGTFLAVPVAAGINVALHELFPSEFGALPAESQAEIAAELKDEQPGVPASPD